MIDAVLAAVLASAPYRADRHDSGVPPVPEEAYRTAAGGTVATGLVEVPGVAARKAYGVGLIDVDIASLWAGLNDETHHPGYTSTGYSELLSGAPCASGRHVLQFLPVPMVSDRWWITILTANEKIGAASGGSVRELWWTSSTDATEVKSERGKQAIADGIPVAFTKGAWLLLSVDATHTLVEYYVWSDPGGSVPAGAASWFAAGGVTDTLDAIARFTKDGKSQCPKG